MKRKILVLLLAMTLALSLMPMMAFADNDTATDADREDVLYRKAIITKLTSENKSVLKARNAAGNAAVQRGPRLCPHTDKFTEYWFDDDECTIVDCGENHEVTGQIYEYTKCKECLETLDEKYLGYTTVTERHCYEHGKCWLCLHLNTCTHPSTSIVSYYNPDEDEECKIIDRGAYHELSGFVDRITRCKDCGDLLDLEVFENMTVEAAHFFNSAGACEECGHLNDKTRLYGSSRYDTAVTVANKYKELSGSEKFENVIVAYGLDYPDALSGGYLAKVKNAPILLVQPSVEDYIVNYIDENIADGGTVYILGSAGVVSSAFENKIEAKGITRGIKPRRLGGKDRYETNLKILEEAGVDDEELMVCTGTGFADSLSASAVGKPILLVGSNLTDAQKEYIQGRNRKKLYLIGSTGVVSDEVEAELGDLGYGMERLWGPNRYETSKAVAERFFNNPQTVVLAYALNFPDGLSGGPLAMLEDAPIILAHPNNTEAARAYVKSVGATNNFTLGGPSLVTDIAVEIIMGD